MKKFVHNPKKLDEVTFTRVDDVGVLVKTPGGYELMLSDEAVEALFGFHASCVMEEAGPDLDFEP